MLPAHQLQGELAIPVLRYRHPRTTITAGQGWGICRFTHTSQACRARPRTTWHARICNGAPVLNEARTPENSLRDDRSHNLVLASGCWSLPVRYPWGQKNHSRILVLKIPFDVKTTTK
jgi:hypothetical protein